MSTRPNSPLSSRKRGPARWTKLEIVLIIVSLMMIAFPLYVETYRWVRPVAVPAAPRPQEAATATPYGELPAPTEQATELAPTDLPTEQATEPAPTDIPVEQATATPTQVDSDINQRATFTATTEPGSTATATATTDPGSTATATATTDPGSTATATATTDPGSTATATATTDPGSTATPTATDTVVAGTQTPTSTPPLGEASLAVSKSSSASDVTVGQAFSFAVTVHSNSATSIDIEVRDNIDQQLEITSASTNAGSCSISGSTVICNVKAQRNSPASINISVRVRSDAIPGSDLKNQALAQDSLEHTAASEVVIVRVVGGGSGGATATATVGQGTPTATLPPGVTATATSIPGATATPGSKPTATPGKKDSKEKEKTPTPPVGEEPPALLPPTPVEGGPLKPTATRAASRPRTATPRPTRTGQAGPTSTAAVGATATPVATTGATAQPSLTAVTSNSENIFFSLGSDWGSAFPEQNINYTIGARNNKTESIRQVTISISMPSNLELTGKPTSDRGDPEVSGNRVTMRLNELAAGQGIEITIPVRIKAGVAVGTRIVAQAEMSFTGLSNSLYSNIVPVLVVGKDQSATATVQPSATTQATVQPSATVQATTQPSATTQATVQATTQPSATTQATVQPSPTQATTAVAPSNDTQLPNTSSGIPLSGLALLGMTLMVRTVRLHRAQTRI